MTTLSIFLASSIVEFQNERLAIKRFIDSLNSHFISRGFYIQLILCENVSNALSGERKQEEYNQRIRSSGFFFLLAGCHLGELTLEEYHVAAKQKSKTGAPQIRVHFTQPPEERDQTVLHFQSLLKEGELPLPQASLYDIKLDFLKTAADFANIPYTLQDGCALMDGQVVLRPDLRP